MLVRYLIHPALLVSILFLGQLAFWVSFMPERATIPGAADKYFSVNAILLWSFLFITFLSGIILGSYTRFSYKKKSLQIDPIYWWRWAWVVLLISFLGELVYIRLFFQQPSLFSEALFVGNLAVLGEAVRAERIVGLSSLNNLFLLGEAMLLLLIFHPKTPANLRRRAARWLWILSVLVLIHALLLAARMFFVYYLLTLLAGLLVLRFQERKVSWKVMSISFLLLFGVVWTGELLRSGLYYSKSANLPLASPEVQSYVWQRLVQAYLAADFNNALVVLDCEPSLQMWYTTMLSFVLENPHGYQECPSWESAYGTVNVLALWWFDWGYGAFIVAFVVGLALGIFYRWRSYVFDLDPRGLFYFIAFPGLFAIIRINYFFLTIFVLPFLALCALTIWTLLIKSLHRRLLEEAT